MIFIFQSVNCSTNNSAHAFDESDTLLLYEDIMDQRHDDEDDYSLLDIAGHHDDLEGWYDEPEVYSDMSPDFTNFEKETIETFQSRRLPIEHPPKRSVSYAAMRQNGVGSSISEITTEVANYPSKLYSLVYNDTVSTILDATNLAVDLHNASLPPSSAPVAHFEPQDVRSYMGVKILFMLEKGKHVRYQDFYCSRLRKKAYNFFSSIPNSTMDNLHIPPWERYTQFVKFMDQGGPTEYVDKQTFKSSSAREHQPLGGYYLNVNGSDGKPCQCVDLNKKIRPIQDQFNNRSILFMQPDQNLGWVWQVY